MEKFRGSNHGTCIIGYIDRDEHKIWMGSDSFLGNDIEYHLVKHPKIMKVLLPGSELDGKPLEMLIGGAGAVRIDTVIKKMSFPELTSDLDTWVDTHFVEALRKEMWEAGYIWWENGFESVPQGVELLLGVGGHLYTMWSDLSVAQQDADYMCVGAGAFHADGAMSALNKLDLAPKEIVKLALEAAEAHSPWVRKPFHIFSVKY